MKKVLPILLIVILLISAKVLSPISKSKFKEASPSGMVLVKRGAFLMGTVDSTGKNVWGTTNDTMKVSIESFWMDETEVTNHLYSQFVNWVADSVMRRQLSYFIGSKKSDKNEDKNEDKNDLPLDWKKKINFKKQEGSLRIFFDKDQDGKPVINNSALNYTYNTLDQIKFEKFDKIQRIKDPYFRNRIPKTYEESIDSSYVVCDSSQMPARWDIVWTKVKRQVKSRGNFFITNVVNIYPDTACWNLEFRGEYNSMYLNQYFSGKSYRNYPVVGVSWEQANAFCHWKSKIQKKGKSGISDLYRLPTEAEWEYAARGGRNGKVNKLYPWKAESLVDKKGCYFANFKPIDGDFTNDGYLITAPVGSFPANELGLFELVGNVSEWTQTAYFPSGNKLMSTMNPTVTFNWSPDYPYEFSKKVVRGGSFKDVFEKINTTLRDVKYQNEQLPYVGFRCVRTALP